MKNDGSYNKWFLSYVLLSSIFLIAVSMINYRIDCAFLFHNSEFDTKAIDVLTKGKNIAGFINFDERHFQKSYIEKNTHKMDIIAVGSSRTLNLRKRAILGKRKEKKFFNHSVSGASLEDYISIIGLYKEKGYMPSRVILGIDPWIFNRNKTQNKWKFLSPSYDKMIKEIYGVNAKATVQDDNRFLQLLNVDYLKANIMSWLNPKKNNPDFYIADDLSVDSYIKESDGSLHYPYKIRFQKDEETIKKAREYVKFPVYLLENFGELSNTVLFEDFVDFLRKKDVEVVFFLPPYHPLTYELLTTNPRYAIIRSAEAYIRNYASREHIKVIGSYDPNALGLKSKDFTDGMHIRDKGIEAIFKSLHEPVTSKQ
ncbi:MAG: DUF1574 family protein [Deltaproteobacteria bacterium]|nr:DUF1574 family protein [Deltaproteobacteria bacterium]